MSGGLQTEIHVGNEQNSESDWNPPPAFDSDNINEATHRRKNTKDIGSNSSREISSLEGEIFSYFQSRPAVQTAERKERPGKKTQLTHHQHSSDQK